MSRSASGAATRAVAARAVHAVVREGRNLDHALAGAGANDLPPRERAFVRALSFGTLRTHLRNSFLLDRLLDKPLKSRDAITGSLLSVACFELLDAAAPDYAAVSAAVDATRLIGRPGMRGLVNAILRRLLREKDAHLAAAAADPVAHWCHPAWLLHRLQADWPDDYAAILAAGNRQAPMWLRINTLRTGTADWLARAAGAGVAASAPLPDLPAAVLLEQPVGVDALPDFAAGDCSVQDAASQLAAVLLDPQPGMRILDACAAPGGKTGHLLEAGGGRVDVVAVDNVAARLERVTENLARLQLDAQVRCGDAAAPDEWWDGTMFDRILVDAPCSATGVIRRHPDIRFLRREADIDELQALQLRLLRALWPLLKPGGRLLYSTCSLLRAENETVVAAFLADEPTARELDLADSAAGELGVAQRHGVQLLPGQRATDGFYYALMTRLP